MSIDRLPAIFSSRRQQANNHIPKVVSTRSQATLSRRIAWAAGAFEKQKSGHGRQWVAVFMNEDTIVIALHSSLTAAEKALAKSPAGAASVRELHRRLFTETPAVLHRKIMSITGLKVRDTTVEIEPTTGHVVQIFTTDTLGDRFLADRQPVGTFAMVRSAGSKAERGNQPRHFEMKRMSAGVKGDNVFGSPTSRLQPPAHGLRNWAANPSAGPQVATVRRTTKSGKTKRLFKDRIMTTQDQPIAQPHLNGRHQRTYEAISRHPVAHNLEWHDVLSLLNEMANVSEKHNGSFEVTRNGQVLTLHVPHHKDAAPVQMVLDIRHFLEKSNELSVLSPAAPAACLLVVIDHHEAKIYRTEWRDSVPKQLVPYDPHGFRRHLVSDNDETHGKRAPERKSFYEAIAATLRGADQILIFGHGTGESSAMEQLVAELKRNHGDVADHIVGAIVVDASHTTEDQLLTQAREFFAIKAV